MFEGRGDSMKETMGQIIKRLRKERNFTQEELAEQLGITFQAVSKWENDTGMPDVSQIIPLATIFGVSTDVLFGMSGKGNREEVQRIIQSAIAFITEPATKESVYLKFRGADILSCTHFFNSFPHVRI
jgi:DNA-binding protein